MADIPHPNLHGQRPHTAPYGNVYIAEEEYTTAAAVAANDEILMLNVPSGARIFDVRLTVHDASNAGVTVDVGLKQLGSGDFTDDLDMFLDGASIAAVGEFSSWASTHHKPIHVTDPNVVLVVQPKQAITNAAELRVQVFYEFKGNP